MLRIVLRKWCADEEGATASEYAFMLVLIIVAVIASVSAVGNSTANGWSNNVSKVTSACNGS
ncbi:MAG: Flp family type IVb pilin [Isosphaeraceae bacterium]